MKRLIFFVMVLCTTVFSADNIVVDWKNDLKEIGTHGENYRAEWTKKILMPAGCNVDIEQRFDEIVLVSTNILNKKPSEWLNGKYLVYVNTNCHIWSGLSGTPKDFERIVNTYNGTQNKNSQGNNWMAFWVSIILVASVMFWLYMKAISLFSEKIFRK